MRRLHLRVRRHLPINTWHRVSGGTAIRTALSYFGNTRTRTMITVPSHRSDAASAPPSAKRLANSAVPRPLLMIGRPAQLTPRMYAQTVGGSISSLLHLIRGGQRVPRRRHRLQREQLLQQEQLHLIRGGQQVLRRQYQMHLHRDGHQGRTFVQATNGGVLAQVRRALARYVGRMKIRPLRGQS